MRSSEYETLITILDDTTITMGEKLARLTPEQRHAIYLWYEEQLAA
jgi:hypothetical protein